MELTGFLEIDSTLEIKKKGLSNKLIHLTNIYRAPTLPGIRLEAKKVVTRTEKVSIFLEFLKVK